MTWNEHAVIRAISRQTLNRRCILLVDNCNWTGHECDVLGVTMDMRIIDVEVKVSRADLKADAGKEKWWRRVGWGFDGPRQLQQWPPKVWKHYYAMPADIWKPELVEALPSPASGVLLLKERHGQLYVGCERRATPAPDAHRLQPADVLNIARLANLRMWDAYAQRDAARSTASRRVPA